MRESRPLPSLLPALLAAGLVLPTAGCDVVRAALFGGAPGPSTETGLSRQALPDGELRTVAAGLDTPWEIRFLPGGDLLVTERRGTLLRLSPREGEAARVVERHDVPGVRETSEGGLMGMALHPGYPDPPWIYLCHTADDGGLVNRVVRFRLLDGTLSGRRVVLDGMAAASIHDGCRMEFGPDGHLFVTMGDAGRSDLAQDPEHPNGKIHRVAPDGDVPTANPRGTTVWSWGHRNPQGLAFDDRGRLWSTEHGPSGLRSGRDEVNLVRPGRNYGWPEVTGDETQAEMVGPVLQSGSDTWAPAGLAHRDGRLFFGGLAGRALYELRGAASVRDPGAADLRLLRHFGGELGRIRAVRIGPDGQLYFATSNRDGRGRPAERDDRIFRIDPALLRP